MLDGTRPYRGKNFVTPVVRSAAEAPVPPPETPRADTENVENPDRRAWLSSIVPALGSGLVEILRTSNNLKRELSEIMKKESK